MLDPTHRARCSRSPRRRRTTPRPSPIRPPRAQAFAALQADEDDRAAAAPRDAGPVRAGLGVQDRDRRSRALDTGADHARRRRSRSSRRPRTTGSLVDGLPGPRRPPPADRRHGRSTSPGRPRSAATSGTRWPGSRPAATGWSTEAGRARVRRRRSRSTCRPRSASVTNGDGRRRAGSPTTSSWRRRRSGRARRS